METVNLAKTVVKANAPAVAVPSDKAVRQPSVVETTGKLLPKAAEENLTTQRVDNNGSPKNIETTVKALNDFVQNIQRGIEFSVHEETGREFVIVTDKKTGEEIRQFPSDEVLAIGEQIAEMLAVPDERALGLFISETA